MSFELAALEAAIAVRGRVVRVVVAEVKGSTPREAGAAMLVWDGGQAGTIGGGALEWEAAARARGMLAVGGARIDRLALGPALQQCCGGAVTLVSEVWDAETLAALRPVAGLVLRAVEPGAPMPLAVRRRLRVARGEGVAGGPALSGGWLVEPLAAPRRAVWVWGAGHVGRALVAVLAPLPGLEITWVDTDAARFPAAVPEGVTSLVAAEPVRLAAHAPGDAEHLVMTYSHPLDLALCHALLLHGFARAGVIGSATKWARFRKRLGELGHDARATARIDCPIGDPSFGKHPHAIAVSVAAGMLAAHRREAAAEGRTGACPRVAADNGVSAADRSWPDRP